MEAMASRALVCSDMASSMAEAPSADSFEHSEASSADFSDCSAEALSEALSCSSELATEDEAFCWDSVSNAEDFEESAMLAAQSLRDSDFFLTSSTMRAILAANELKALPISPISSPLFASSRLVRSPSPSAISRMAEAAFLIEDEISMTTAAATASAVNARMESAALIAEPLEIFRLISSFFVLTAAVFLLISESRVLLMLLHDGVSEVLRRRTASSRLPVLASSTAADLAVSTFFQSFRMDS